MTAEPTLEERIRATMEADADGGRLPSGFAAGVVAMLPTRQATARFKMRSSFAAAGAAAVLVVVAILASQVAPGPGPSTSPSTSAGATTSSPPAATPSAVTSTYSDGLPRSIGGEPVYRGPEAATHALAMADATPFLVGGQYSLLLSTCVPTVGPPRPTNALLPECEVTLLDGIPVIPNGLLVGARDGVSDFVVRVHVTDPRAIACAPLLRPRCEKAIVVERVMWVGPVAQGDHRADLVDAAAGRFEDGLPRSVAGQPVHRGSEAIAFAATVGDTASFLVGGWFTQSVGGFRCPAELPGHRDWRNDCGRPGFSDTAGTFDGAMYAVITFRFSGGEPASGPVAVSVHVHDPRAADCTPDPTICDRMMVVDGVVWSGDAATDPVGLTTDKVAAALRSVDAAFATKPLGPGVSPRDCWSGIPGGTSLVVSGGHVGPPSVTYVGIAPNALARARAVPDRPVFDPKAVMCRDITVGAPNDPDNHVVRWLAYDNVALLVTTHTSPTAGDRAFIDQLMAALERAESGAP
jgi:hypothetical protein